MQRKSNGFHSVHALMVVKIQENVLAINGIANFWIQHIKKRFVQWLPEWLQFSSELQTATTKYLDFANVTQIVDAIKTSALTSWWLLKTKRATNFWFAVWRRTTSLCGVFLHKKTSNKELFFVSIGVKLSLKSRVTWGAATTMKMDLVTYLTWMTHSRMRSGSKKSNLVIKVNSSHFALTVCFMETSQGSSIIRATQTFNLLISVAMLKVKHFIG